MTKRKAPTPQAADETKRPRVTVATLQAQNYRLNDHLNMCVSRINLLTEHVQFLNAKFLESTKLYNREFRRLNDRCDEIEGPQLEKCRNFLPEVFGCVGEEHSKTTVDPIHYFDEFIMTEEELADVIAQPAN